jgi:hypothetical protein
MFHRPDRIQQRRRHCGGITDPIRNPDSIGRNREMNVRPLPVALTIFLAAMVTSGKASAQNYPWCAYYGDDSGENCGFTTYAQCMEDIAGMGGSCERNTQYVPSAGPHATLRHRPRHKDRSS